MPPTDETLRVRVVCSELPGRRFVDSTSGGEIKEPVCLGVQRGYEVVDVVVADAAKAEFSLEFRVGRQGNGKPNFLGPFAHGTPVDRFFYLVWGVRDAGGFAMFRRLKVRLGHLTWKQIRRSIRAGQRQPITVRLRMTDKRGGPMCATPPPDHVDWDGT